MTPSDVLFQRAILASLLVFALVGTAYFRLVRPQAWIVAIRFLPITGAAFAAAPFVVDMPLVAKALLWVTGFGSLLLCAVAMILTRRVMAFLRRSKRRQAAEPAVAADDRRQRPLDG